MKTLILALTLSLTLACGHNEEFVPQCAMVPSCTDVVRKQLAQGCVSLRAVDGAIDACIADGLDTCSLYWDPCGLAQSDR